MSFLFGLLGIFAITAALLIKTPSPDSIFTRGDLYLVGLLFLIWAEIKDIHDIVKTR